MLVPPFFLKYNSAVLVEGLPMIVHYVKRNSSDGLVGL